MGRREICGSGSLPHLPIHNQHKLPRSVFPPNQSDRTLASRPGAPVLLDSRSVARRPPSSFRPPRVGALLSPLNSGSSASVRRNFDSGGLCFLWFRRRGGYLHFIFPDRQQLWSFPPMWANAFQPSSLLVTFHPGAPRPLSGCSPVDKLFPPAVFRHHAFDGSKGCSPCVPLLLSRSWSTIPSMFSGTIRVARMLRPPASYRLRIDGTVGILITHASMFPLTLVSSHTSAMAVPIPAEYFLSISRSMCHG